MNNARDKWHLAFLTVPPLTAADTHAEELPNPCKQTPRAGHALRRHIKMLIQIDILLVLSTAPSLFYCKHKSQN